MKSVCSGWVRNADGRLWEFGGNGYGWASRTNTGIETVLGLFFQTADQLLPKYIANRWNDCTPIMLLVHNGAN